MRPDQAVTTWETEGERPCECGFSPDKCSANRCLRKKVHLAGLTPNSEWPMGAPIGRPPRYFIGEYTDGPSTSWNVIDRQTQEWVRRFPTEQQASDYAAQLNQEA